MSADTSRSSGEKTVELSCPFCGKSPEECFGEITGNRMAYCHRCGIVLDSDRWEKRPLEDALRTRLTLAEQRIDFLNERNKSACSWEERALKAESRLTECEKALKQIAKWDSCRASKVAQEALKSASGEGGEK